MGKFKNIIGIVAGTMSAAILIYLLEYINMKFIFPPPTGYSMLDMHDPKKVVEIFSKMPVSAFVSVLIIYAVTSLAGGAITSIISGKLKPWPAVITGTLLAALGLGDNIMFNAPTWYTVSAVIVSIAFAYLGFFATRKKP